MDEKLSRRDLFGQSAALGVLVVVSAAGCSKTKSTAALSCSDTTGLSAPDILVRTQLAYADVSTEPGKICTACQQFLPGPADACGACKVLRGPISPNGSCKAFAAKML